MLRVIQEVGADPELLEAACDWTQSVCGIAGEPACPNSPEQVINSEAVQGVMKVFSAFESVSDFISSALEKVVPGLKELKEQASTWVINKLKEAGVRFHSGILTGILELQDNSSRPKPWGGGASGTVLAAAAAASAAAAACAYASSTRPQHVPRTEPGSSENLIEPCNPAPATLLHASTHNRLHNLQMPDFNVNALRASLPSFDLPGMNLTLNVYSDLIVRRSCHRIEAWGHPVEPEGGGVEEGTLHRSRPPPRHVHSRASFRPPGATQGPGEDNHRLPP